MRLYDFQRAPNPRRVGIFIAEKGLEIPTTEINLLEGKQFTDDFRAVNPRCYVPVLETDTGERLTEVVAICAYLEELYPEPPLFGRSAEERARVRMWDHIVEVDGLFAVAEALRNSGEMFENRALPGPEIIPQIPALVGRGRARAESFFSRMDQRLAESPYIAGDHFSQADISLLVTADVASWVDVDVFDGRPALKEWHERVSARPSAST